MVKRRAFCISLTFAASLLLGCSDSSKNDADGSESGSDGGAMDGRDQGGLQPRPCGSFTPHPGGTISTDTTLDGCYLVENDMSVSGGATLTIAPGSTIKFKANVQLTIKTDGALAAAGTSELPILLSGEQATRGYWKGIFFDRTNSQANNLSHVILEYGGGGTAKANIEIYATNAFAARMVITNSIIRESSKYGFYAYDYVNLSGFSSNTITKNVTGAGHIYPSVAQYLDSASSYAGNDKDVVELNGGTVSSNQSWQAINAAYLITADITSEAQLTVGAGAKLVFKQNTRLKVDPSGSLTAVGTAEAPITFTGEQPTRGYWNGLYFDRTNSQYNTLTFATIEYGGGGVMNGNLVVYATNATPARVLITNSTLRESAKYGFFVYEYASLSGFSGNTVTKNTTGAGRIHPSIAQYLDSASSYTGNDKDAVELSGGTISANQTWAAINAAYLVTENLNAAARLTISPGARLVFQQNTRLTIQAEGALTAVGTEASPIVFTGEQQTAGYWHGIHLERSNKAENQIRYATVECGGGGASGTNQANIVTYATGAAPARVSIANNTIRMSGKYGIYLSKYVTCNDDVSTANGFSENVAADVYVEQ